MGVGGRLEGGDISLSPPHPLSPSLYLYTVKLVMLTGIMFNDFQKKKQV